MGRKLHRKRRSYYRRRRGVTLRPILGWVLAAVILIPGSFFAAKYLFKEKPTPSAPVGGTAATTTVSGASATTTTAASVVETSVFRGFTLPATALNDTAKLTATAKEAASAGFNCVVIELKNKQGNLLYATETESGKAAGAITADAVSLKALTDAFAALRAEGIAPIPLLYCFEDAVAPRTLADAKVVTNGHADWTWYDGDPKNGGKPWLNPYADAAQAYITALAEELQTAGAGGIMLDGVYFPAQTSQADFTTAGDATLSKGDVLKKFVARMDTLCDVPVLLRCSANAALGNTTASYHISPLELGAALVVPDMRQSAVGEKLSLEGQMLTVSADTMADTVARVAGAVKTRVKDGNVALLLDGNAAQVNALKATDKNASFILGEGAYAFSAFAE